MRLEEVGLVVDPEYPVGPRPGSLHRPDAARRRLGGTSAVFYGHPISSLAFDPASGQALRLRRSRPSRDREGRVFAGSDTRTPRSGIPTLREYGRIIGNFLHGLGENDPEHEPFNQG